jgi:hypothetical protein
MNWAESKGQGGHLQRLDHSPGKARRAVPVLFQLRFQPPHHDRLELFVELQRFIQRRGEIALDEELRQGVRAALGTRRP